MKPEDIQELPQRAGYLTGYVEVMVMDLERLLRMIDEMHKVSVGTKCPRGFLDRWLPEDDPALLDVRRRAAEGREIVAAIEKVRKEAKEESDRWIEKEKKRKEAIPEEGKSSA